MLKQTEVCSNGRLKGIFNINGTTVTGYVKNNPDRVSSVGGLCVSECLFFEKATDSENQWAKSYGVKPDVLIEFPCGTFGSE